MKSIKLQRTESLLKEIVGIALSQLNDTRLSSLNVVDVQCSKGKYNAQVFLSADYDEKEQREILQQLKKANGIIKEYCLEETGWFRCPDFKFIFDNTLEQQNKLESIFQQIKSENDDKQ